MEAEEAGRRAVFSLHKSLRCDRQAELNLVGLNGGGTRFTCVENLLGGVPGEVEQLSGQRMMTAPADGTKPPPPPSPQPLGLRILLFLSSQTYFQMLSLLPERSTSVRVAAKTLDDPLPASRARSSPRQVPPRPATPGPLAAEWWCWSSVGVLFLVSKYFCPKRRILR